MLHKILSAISATCLFIAFAGTAGAVDTDTLTGQSLIAAGILILIGALTAYLAYLESSIKKIRRSRSRSGKKKYHQVHYSTERGGNANGKYDIGYQTGVR